MTMTTLPWTPNRAHGNFVATLDKSISQMAREVMRAEGFGEAPYEPRVHHAVTGALSMGRGRTGPACAALSEVGILGTAFLRVDGEKRCVTPPGTLSYGRDRGARFCADDYPDSQPIADALRITARAELSRSVVYDAVKSCVRAALAPMREYLRLSHYAALLERSGLTVPPEAADALLWATPCAPVGREALLAEIAWRRHDADAYAAAGGVTLAEIEALPINLSEISEAMGYSKTYLSTQISRKSELGEGSQYAFRKALHEKGLRLR